MAHIFIPNGVRVVLQASGYDGQIYMHALHMRAPNAAPDYADVLTCAQTVAAWWNSNYRNMTQSSVVGRQVVATGMDAVPAAQATVLLTTTGTRAGTPLPSEVSCSVKFFTHLSGRRNYGGGRTFPAVESDIQGDHFTSAYISAANGVWQNLINQANTAGYPLVVASLADIALKVIAGEVVLDDVADSMRRRTINRGR